MPIYEYRCRACGEITDAFRSVDERDSAPPCQICGTETRKILSVSRPIGDMEPYFDDNLETYIKSKKHRRGVMKDKGVSEKYGKGWT